jgi:S-(hydroxymethyl)glutathione dehydrogenase / alcohol dehydrogenase
MKAAVCREFGQPLVIEDLTLDPPQAGEVLVKLSACAICHSDIYFLEGKWGGTLPAVYGHEAAGLVAEVGPGVARARPGDSVVVTLIRSCGQCYFCAHGQETLCDTRFPLDQATRLHGAGGEPIVQGLRTAAFAEYVVVHESQLVVVPPALPPESASLLACGVITGVGAVTNTARVPLGGSVAIIGAGGVGLNCIQGAHLCGAQPIVAVDLLPRKLEAALSFGATHALNPGTQDVLAAVRDLTGGRGVDYVFASAGSGRAIDLGLALMRRGGTMVMVGMPPTGVMTQLEMGNVANDSHRILGSKMGETQLGVDVPRLVQLYQQGRLKLDELITARFPLEHINAAIAAVNQGVALRNVIVF